MNFEWKGINVLCQLPRLKVLRLLSSGIGKEWELSKEDVFHSLIYFEIFSTHLKHWKASDINFPILQRLLLRDCFQLREIPDSFADIWTLKSIELTRCLPSAVNSAKQIREHLQDFGNDCVVIENIILMKQYMQELTSDEDEAEEES
nr:uncharacterized protein LOC109184589 isoform X1 [Ipomoea trifida]